MGMRVGRGRAEGWWVCVWGGSDANSRPEDETWQRYARRYTPRVQLPNCEIGGLRNGSCGMARSAACRVRIRGGV